MSSTAVEAFSAAPRRPAHYASAKSAPDCLKACSAAAAGAASSSGGMHAAAAPSNGGAHVSAHTSADERPDARRRSRTPDRGRDADGRRSPRRDEGGRGGRGPSYERKHERGRPDDRMSRGRDDRDRGAERRYDDRERRYDDRDRRYDDRDRRYDDRTRRYDDRRYDDRRYDDRRNDDRRADDRRYDDRRFDDSRRGGSSSRRSPSPRGRGASPPRRATRTREEEELFELTRDARTVFVTQLQVRATERDVREYFEQVGPVEEVSLIRDRAGKSKGFGYIEFSDLESVPKALMLNGQKFCMKHPACTCSGFPIAIKPSEAEKNYAAMAEKAGGAAGGARAEHRIFVGNLPTEVTEGDLKVIAEAIGPVDKVAMLRDERGAPRGYASITFATIDAANTALASLNDFPINGVPIKVGKLNAMGDVVTANGEKFSLELGGNKALSAQARAALMAQLAGATTQAVQTLGSTLMAAAAATGAGGVPVVLASLPSTSGVPSTAASQHRGAPTPCVLLKNMFDASQETAPNWDVEIRDEVVEECSKYGKVVYAHVVRDSLGYIYLMFSDVAGAMAASNSLGGRLFAGKIIQVEFVPLADFLSKFPDAADKV